MTTKDFQNIANQVGGTLGIIRFNMHPVIKLSSSFVDSRELSRIDDLVKPFVSIYFISGDEQMRLELFPYDISDLPENMSKYEVL